MKFDNDHIFIFGLCIFMAFLAFKPSEPYLSQFLICNYKTEQGDCKDSISSDTCISNSFCQWNAIDSSCSLTSCDSLLDNQCNGFNYCTFNKETNHCENLKCYKNFTENEVNNEIFPWSTYAYLIFLVVLMIGPMIQLVSYRVAIIIGVMGRVATRFLLIYGTTVPQMQVMQVTYALGTAAEDLFTAYIYSVVPLQLYQKSTSYLKTSAMMASVCASILGDILVTQTNASIWVLMVISATSVTLGSIFGCFILKDPPSASNRGNNKRHHNSNGQSFTSHLNEIMSSFVLQIKLIIAIINKSKYLKLLLFWWIIGSSVYTILIGYEISIYSEFMRGGDTWNGSVLAVIQICSSVGAMLPVWLNIDLLTATAAVPSATTSSSSSSSFYEADFEPTITDHTAAVDRESTVSLYISIAGLVSLISLIIYTFFWSLYISIPSLTVFFMSWQFINVIFLAKLATYVNESCCTAAAKNAYLDPQSSSDKEDYEMLNTETGDSSDSSQRQHTTATGGNFAQRKEGKDDRMIVVSSSSGGGDNQLSDVSLDDNDEMQQRIIGTTTNTAVAATSTPIHSTAVMFVLILSVVLQVILQIILFSWLNVSLRTISVILCCMYGFTTVVYVTHTLAYRCRRNSPLTTTV